MAVPLADEREVGSLIKAIFDRLT